jgi:Response regulator containing CheY-like receiver, AAA-type ATPase, and DNA-binding domains
MKVLIIDDEKGIRFTMKEILEFEGHQVTLAADGKEGVEAAMHETFDAIFCDIKMPNMDGLEVLDALNEAGCESAVIMISGHGTIDTAVDCIKKGAFDFIQKPLDLNRILITLKNATDKTTLVKETKSLKKKIGGKYDIIGESPAIVHIKDVIDRVAPTDARVLIMGGNGTGKNWSQDVSTTRATVLPCRSSRSTALPYQGNSSKASFSGTRRELSPPPSSSTRASSSRLTAERCSSTRLAT